MNAFADDRKPLVILAAVVLVLAIALFLRGIGSLDLILFSILQYFATIGPVALGLGLTMIAREFDISVGSTMSLAGCVAVIVGQRDPNLGALAGIATGVAVGFLQGVLVTGLGLSSISVSLGALITLAGLSYVVTGNQTISLNHADITQAINAPIGSVFSVRSLFAIGCFAAAGVVVALTRVGAELTATGSDRVAAATAGVRVNRVVVVVFMLSGGLSAASGVFLSYGLSVASPSGLTDVLVPAISAAIVGGVALTGGRGSPVGIACGALTLCTLNAGLNALGVSPTMQQIILAGVLFTVAVVAAPRLNRIWMRRTQNGGGAL
ncbi:MAG: ABC transporter permease [Ancalomicrobiaceae bacterium]|nr:ABC transporter permease [Ancalomicrobiaceae bacterium]